MNNIAKVIAHVFCCEGYSRCDDCPGNKKCWRLGKANALYNAHVNPLENALAKAEADKAALVEALEEMVAVSELICDWGNVPVSANVRLELPPPRPDVDNGAAERDRPLLVQVYRLRQGHMGTCVHSRSWRSALLRHGKA